MTSIHSNNFSRVHLKSTMYNNYRYPSYLLKVVPPEVYSCDDIRNMLVPKTYGTRNVVPSHSHTDVLSAKSLVELNDAKSTKRNSNEVRTPNRSTDENKKRNNANECQISGLPLSRHDSAGNQYIAYKANINNGKTIYDEQVSYDALNIHKPFVIEETNKDKKCHISPTDSGYMSRSNSDLDITVTKTKEIRPQIHDEEEENNVFYDYDDQEENQSLIKNALKQQFSETRETGVYELIQMCKKCHQQWPLNDFTLLETNKSHIIDVIDVIDEKTNVLEANNFFHNEPSSL